LPQIDQEIDPAFHGHPDIGDYQVVFFCNHLLDGLVDGKTDIGFKNILERFQSFPQTFQKKFFIIDQ
jgi:hypothetical protein